MFSWLFKREPRGPVYAEITPPGQKITVAPNETLLQAALAAGIPFPHNCRVGSCTTCKCRLRSGKVKELTETSYVLSAEDLRAGYILACQTLVLSDVKVELDHLDTNVPTHPVKQVSGVIAGTARSTHDILEVHIALDEPIRYTAGQYAEVSVPGMATASRNYSFATAPVDAEQKEIRFYIRHVPGGEFTDWLHASDRTGTRVEVRAPYGGFWLRPGSEPLLCIAGGSGMAPIKAILEQAQRTGVAREVLYLFGARTQADLYGLGDIDRLRREWAGRFRFVPVLSQEPADSDWRGARGLVTDFIDKQGLDPAQCHAYLCGPPPMVDAAIARLTALGLAPIHIHFDKFLDRSHAPAETARAVLPD